MAELSSKKKSPPADPERDGGFRDCVISALHLRLGVYAIAAPVILFLGTHWPGGLAGTMLFLVGFAAILDLLHLSALGTRLGLRAVTLVFTMAHVLLIAAAMVFVAGMAMPGDDGMPIPQQHGLLAMAVRPATIFFFAAVIFSMTSGLPALPLVAAVAGAVCWLAILVTGFVLSGLPLPDLSGEIAGPGSTLAARALLMTAIGSAMLVACGLAGRQALIQAEREGEEVDARRRRHDLLGQYFPQKLAGRLSELDTLFDDVTEFECAVLLVDISHFQRKMETASLHESGQLIQEFHELVSEVVFTNGGMLRQMEGDSLYAVFGLLDEGHNSVERAFLCAQTMAEAARLWRSERIDRGKSPAEIFMGIDFGRCVIVPNPDPERPDFSMVGAPFSAARRMERVARLVASDLAMTGHAVRELKEGGAAALVAMMDHRGPQKVDDRRGVVEVRTWSLPLSGEANIGNVA